MTKAFAAIIIIIIIIKDDAIRRGESFIVFVATGEKSEDDEGMMGCRSDVEVVCVWGSFFSLRAPVAQRTRKFPPSRVIPFSSSSLKIHHDGGDVRVGHRIIASALVAILHTPQCSQLSSRYQAEEQRRSMAMADSIHSDGERKASLKVPQRTLDYGRCTLPSSVPIIGLGCSSFSTFFWDSSEVRREGGKWTLEEMDRSHPRVEEWMQTIHCAIECGITLLDTAPWYGHGTSEVVIGWALEEILVGGSVVTRDDLVINTKLGRYEADPQTQFDFSKQATFQSVERSLQRMKCQYINVLQLHDPEFSPTLNILMEETIPAMMECRDKGWCRALGMTGYPLTVQYQILQQSLDSHGPSSVWDQSLVYSHFNLHDTSLFSQPLFNSSVNGGSFFEFCDNHTMTIMAAAPLSMGLLTQDGPPEWHPATQALKDACREAASICIAHDVDIATLAIMKALSDPRIPCTLLGMKNVKQVKAAAEVAGRFHSIDRETRDAKEILEQVLTKDESNVMEILQDPINGPFATVWTTGEYKWDGVQQAIDFWKTVEGVETEAWQFKEGTKRFESSEQT
jgi:aryl-alcohol dehydrogenase-like predicted oxidoreductase